MSLKKRWAIVCGGIVLLCVVIGMVAWFYTQQLSVLLKNEVYAYIQEIAAQSARSINEKLDGDIQMLRAMAVVFGDEENIDVDHCVELLGSDPVFNQFQRIGIILPDGSGYGQDVTGTDFSDRVYFQQAMRGNPYISDVLVDRTTGLLSYTYAVPIYHKGQIAGVLAAVTNMDVLQALLFEKPFMEAGYTYLIRQDGQVVLHSKGSAVMDNLFNSIALTEESRAEMDYRLTTGSSGSLEYHLDGQSQFMSYVPLGTNDWYVISTLSERAVQARNQRILTLTATATGVACAILLLVGSVFAVAQTRSRERLYRLAYFDQLTELANKNQFQKEARRLLGDRRAPFAYCVLDIKRFQTINDRFGYREGDKFLCHIARILEQSIETGETAARFSADTFHLLLHMETKEALTKRLTGIAQQIAEYAFPGEQEYSVYAGFGIYEVEPHMQVVDTMGDLAKLALGRMHEQLRSTCSFFSEPLQRQIIEAREIENTMRQALKDREFQVYLQPQYRLKDGCLVGAEALVRWIHPIRGVVAPDRFIPLFEKNGFISELDLYMFQDLCAILLRWQADGRKLLPISVNQSRVNLCTPGYLDRLVELFERTGLDPAWLKIEITESAFMDEADTMGDIVGRLHQAGFAVSMDDFGSGYSTLNMLQDLPLDELKIDKNFFRESANSNRGRKIVGNVISMARDLSMDVVAEGVETAEQAEFLQKTGCAMVQGYYYARPMPCPAFEQLTKPGKGKTPV